MSYSMTTPMDLRSLLPREPKVSNRGIDEQITNLMAMVQFLLNDFWETTSKDTLSHGKEMFQSPESS